MGTLDAKDKAFDNLRRKVLQAVDEQRSLVNQTKLAKAPPPGYQGVFTQFVRVKLTKLGMNDEKLAKSIHLPVEQVRMMLEGSLPDAALTDEVISRLAQSLACEANVLRIMLN